MEVIEKAPAKINLSLDVLKKREDGHFELEMVMTSIDLADRITLKSLVDDTIVVQSSNGFMPLDERNLAYRTAKLLKERFDIRQGVFINIEKRIPIAAGLGGGSSDAAATLRGLNKLWGLDLTLDELIKLGVEIDSDVPFCVHGGAALVTGRGEEIEALGEIPQCWVVLVKPKKGISTRTVFEGLPVETLEHPDTEKMLAAIRSSDYEKMTENLGNALETISISRRPQISTIKQKMIQFGADAALMSGSGPTIYALCKNYSRAQRVFNGLKGFCNEVYLVRTLK